MDDTQLTPEQEAELDNQFLKELHDYVSSLPTPSPEDIALYNEKIDLMKQIHAEIKAVYPDFQPEYDALEEFTDEFPKGKYLESTYSVHISNDNNDNE